MNLYARFLKVLPLDRMQVAQVISHNAGEMSTVQFRDGSTTKVRGQGVDVGDNAFIQGNRIQGPAPASTPVILDV